MTTFAEDELLTVALDRVWQASLAASVLVVVVLVLQLVLGKRLAPRWRYALWLLVVARLLMPVSPASSFSLFNWVGWQSKRVADPSAFAAQTAQGAGETPALRSPVLAPRAARDAMVESSSPLVAPVRRGVPSTPSWRNALAGVWLIGAAGYWLLVLVQHWRLANALKCEKPISDTRFLSLLDGCKAALRLRTTVRGIETPRVSMPAVFGSVRPRLLLPKGMLNTWEEPALRHVILHELVHVRRRDVLLNWVLILAQGLHWFNPVVWFAFRRLRAERELVCDAIVLSHLGADDRRAYGSTLIKLVQTFSQPARVPSLTPILTSRNEIERRMTMISQFHPSSRRAALASGVLLAALACFTFTRAAEKKPVAPASTPATEGGTELKEQKERAAQGIKSLEAELAKQQDALNRMQREVDRLQVELQIVQPDAATPVLAAETLRRLEADRIGAAAEAGRSRALLDLLEGLSMNELRSVLPTVIPDPLLQKLLEELGTTDSRIAALTNSLGFNHPDVKAIRDLNDHLNVRVEERVNGILAGLKLKTRAAEVRQTGLAKEIQEARRREVQSAMERQPYFQRKRELENLQTIVDQIKSRIWQEKVEAALPRRSLQ